MIKIRAWYEGKLYYQIEFVSLNDGTSGVKLLGENGVYFTPDSGKVLTTMLWTGLNDKMGNNIWEGDIVEFYYKGKNERCEIVFSDGMFCMKWKDGYVNRYPLNPINYKVVGNIFEVQ